MNTLLSKKLAPYAATVIWLGYCKERMRRENKVAADSARHEVITLVESKFSGEL